MTLVHESRLVVDVVVVVVVEGGGGGVSFKRSKLRGSVRVVADETVMSDEGTRLVLLTSCHWRSSQVGSGHDKPAPAGAASLDEMAGAGMRAVDVDNVVVAVASWFSAATCTSKSSSIVWIFAGGSSSSPAMVMDGGGRCRRYRSSCHRSVAESMRHPMLASSLDSTMWKGREAAQHKPQNQVHWSLQIGEHSGRPCRCLCPDRTHGSRIITEAQTRRDTTRQDRHLPSCDCIEVICPLIGPLCCLLSTNTHCSSFSVQNPHFGRTRSQRALRRRHSSHAKPGCCRPRLVGHAMIAGLCSLWICDVE